MTDVTGFTTFFDLPFRVRRYWLKSKTLACEAVGGDDGATAGSLNHSAMSAAYPGRPVIQPRSKDLTWQKWRKKTGGAPRMLCAHPVFARGDLLMLAWTYVPA